MSDSAAPVVLTAHQLEQGLIQVLGKFRLRMGGLLEQELDKPDFDRARASELVHSLREATDAELGSCSLVRLLVPAGDSSLSVSGVEPGVPARTPSSDSPPADPVPALGVQAGTPGATPEAAAEVVESRAATFLSAPASSTWHPRIVK